MQQEQGCAAVDECAVRGVDEAETPHGLETGFGRHNG